MTSSYQSVRDDALPNAVRYTIRPALEYATPGGESEFILTFRGETLARFHDREHASRTLETLSNLKFDGTDHGTTVTIDTFNCDTLEEGTITVCTDVDQRHAVRLAARWAAANEHQWGYQTYEIHDAEIDPETGLDADGNEPCEVGDIIATSGTSLAICTPADRWWDITESDAITLIHGLSAMLLDGHRDDDAA